jgi:hypothetical protein
MQRLSSKLTYANVVSTIALCLAVGGGAAFAAGKIDSSQIATGGVHTKNLQQRSVTSGKLALGAVRSNQIAPGAVDTGELAPGAVRSGQIGAGAVGTRQLGAGAVGSDQIAKGAIGGNQLAPGAVGADQLAKGAVGPDQLAKGAVDSAALGAGAVTPAQMQFPVALVAGPSGGTMTAPTEPNFIPYPLTDATWMTHAGGVDLIVGDVSATLAPNTGVNGCRIWFEFADNGEFGPEFHPSLELTNGSTSENATRTESIEPFTLPLDPSHPAQLTARIRNNVGSCAGPSTIESMDLRVIELG